MGQMAKAVMLGVEVPKLPKGLRWCPGCAAMISLPIYEVDEPPIRRLSVARATTLCKRHGMRVERLGSGKTPTWTGEAVNLDNLRRANSYMARWPRGWPEPRDRVARNLVHEVAHFLIASPARRKLPNFGAGTDNFGAFAATKVKDPRGDERLATLLGIALCGALAGVPHALDYLSACGGYADGWPEVAKLVRLGLLDENGRPTPKALGKGAHHV